MKKEEISKREVFSRSLGMALLASAGIVGGGVLVVGNDLRAALFTGAAAMFIHYIGYLILAPFIFLFLGPNSDLWKYHWAVPTGGFLGASIVGGLSALVGGQLHEIGIYVLIGGGYGYVTAFAVVRAREKMLER